MEKAETTQKLAFHFANEKGSHSHIWLKTTFPPLRPWKTELSCTVTADFIGIKGVNLWSRASLQVTMLFSCSVLKKDDRTDWLSSKCIRGQQASHHWILHSLLPKGPKSLSSLSFWPNSWQGWLPVFSYCCWDAFAKTIAVGKSLDKELWADSITVLLSNTCFLVGSTSRTMEQCAAGHQVKDHLRNLKVCKSMDPDEMCLWVLRELVEEVAKPLSHHIWENVAVQWRSYQLEKENKEDAVCLTSVAGKILLETLLRYMENKEVIGDSQYTFTQVPGQFSDLLWWG